MTMFHKRYDNVLARDYLNSLVGSKPRWVVISLRGGLRFDYLYGREGLTLFTNLLREDRKWYFVLKLK
jgi:hypothetical protein